MLKPPGGFGERQQPGWDVRQLVFIDETGLNTKMARLHGRCPMGQRCISAIPHGHWQSSTFIAALRQESIEAPFLIEGPVDAEVFTAYLEQVLCPQLRAGDTLILDNLSTHKIHNVSQLLSARGVGVRYLPPYSPDLNPIELAFAKLKVPSAPGRRPHLGGSTFGLGKLTRLLLGSTLPRLLSPRPICVYLNRKCSSRFESNSQ